MESAAMTLMSDALKDAREAARELDEATTPQRNGAAPPPQKHLRGPATALGTHEELHGIPYEPPVIVERYLLEDAAGFVGPGGYGKTTLLLYEGIMIRLGRALYGREVLRPGGATLYLTAEDRRAVVFSRLNKLCTALNLTPAEREHVRTGFFVEDITRSFARLVAGSWSGGAIVLGPTALFYEILAEYGSTALAQAAIDPTALLGPGEAFGADGMAEMMRAGRTLSEQLKCAARFVHHVSQEVARTGIMDQYAGRGSTAFADNSRVNHQLVTVRERQFTWPNVGRFRVPATATDEDLNKGRLLAILVHKLSYDELTRVPIFLLRHGWEFQHLAAEGAAEGPSLPELAAAAQKNAEIVHAFLTSHPDLQLSQTELVTEWRSHYGLSRDQARGAVAQAKAAGMIEEVPLPLEQRQGRKQAFLRPLPPERWLENEL
jgi:regulatory protein RepA